MRFDDDYDVLFNFPKTIKGTAIVNITLGYKTLAAESNSIYVICKVRKWNGTSETEIANKQSDTFATGAAINTTYSKTMQVEITIPEIQFKAGETLRLTIEGYVRLGSGAGNAWFGYGIDPRDRDDDDATAITIKAADTTKLEFHCPFKIDI